MQSKIETIRHSLAHILAYAVGELYPETNFGMGPAIENGFYYDFEIHTNQHKLEHKSTQITPGDLPKIEEKMRELIKQNIGFEKNLVLKEEAKKIFKAQPYKLELIDEIAEDEVSIYKSGEFIDLCAGPHVNQSKEISIDAFKLTKIAGAYWRGKESNPMLTRVYGLAFQTKKELDNYLLKEAEAEKRDHRILGQKLELFAFDEEVGSGLPLWMPKGVIIRNTMENYLIKELTAQGYKFLITPHIGRLKLWQTSGHWELYQENMYSPIDIEKEKYLLKPMNCPFHVKIFKSKIRSWRELPLKFAEFGTVYRYEKSGVLHGLTRVRGFTQDDAHIFCTQEQLVKEIALLLKQGIKILKAFGFKNYDIYLATKPGKFAGSDKDWQKAINSLKYVLGKLKLKYQIDEAGGVFYGPKIDLKIKDSLGRPWQCTTIQVDFNLPERFDINFINKKGRKQRVIMIHRALLGSIERFVGVLLEHYGGALPLWLAPEQIRIIPVGSKHKKYAKTVGNQISENGFRLEIKDETETVSKKIREGEVQKIPYLLVVGDKEITTKTVRVRSKNKDLGQIKLNKFIEKVKSQMVGKK